MSDDTRQNPDTGKQNREKLPEQSGSATVKTRDKCRYCQQPVIFALTPANAWKVLDPVGWDYADAARASSSLGLDLTLWAVAGAGRIRSAADMQTPPKMVLLQHKCAEYQAANETFKPLAGVMDSQPRQDLTAAPVGADAARARESVNLADLLNQARAHKVITETLREQQERETAREPLPERAAGQRDV